MEGAAVILGSYSTPTLIPLLSKACCKTNISVKTHTSNTAYTTIQYLKINYNSLPHLLRVNHHMDHALCNPSYHYMLDQRFSSTEIHVTTYTIECLSQELCRWRSRLLGIRFTPNVNSFLFEVHHVYCPTAPSLAEYFIRRIRLEPNVINTPPSRKV